MVGVDGMDLPLRDRNLGPQSVEAEFVVGVGVIEGDDPLIDVVYVPEYSSESSFPNLFQDPQSQKPKLLTYHLSH
jgi:hypothetical protein